MADRSTGPVKPPVIDLTARNANARPEERPAAAETPPPGTRQRPSRLDLGNASWPLLGGVAVGGAVLGTILTYLLASVLPLPTRGPDIPDLQPELAAQGDKIDALSATLSGLQQSTTRTQVSLDATIAQLDAGLAAVNQSIADVAASIPEPTPPVDLGPIESQIRTLKAQVDAIAAGASGADAGAIAASIASLETGISSLTTRLNGVASTVASLRSDLDAARQVLSQHIASALPNEVGPALKLPLILSGLESAFATGRSFQEELDALAVVVPDFVVPASLSASAGSGLIRPDALYARFETALPEILGARDTTDQDWTQSAIDWAKALLALRPAEEIEGDSPEAIVSRLEGAMERRDYASALALLDALPQAMRDEAVLIAADIRVHAEAAKLIADLRARALATTTATTTP
jgi:hypothetical protein